MEEVDAIIIHFLKQLNIDINDDVKTISELPVEVIVESASRCIAAIKPQFKVPTKISSGVSQRIDVAAQLASLCKDLGYQNKVGYQTFLYHNETELRHVFMFLIEKLPSEDKKSTTKLICNNNKQKIFQDISKKISEDLNSIWVPPCCKATGHSPIGDYVYNQDHTLDIKLNYEMVEEKLRKLNDINKQIKEEDKSVMGKSSTEINTIPDNYASQKTFKELKETSILLRQKLDRLESANNLMDVEYLQVQKKCEQCETDLNNVENILNDIGITETGSDMRDDITDRVHQNLNMLHRKSEEITSKNLSLKLEIEKLKSLNTFSESERSRCRNILINLKETAKSLKEECSKKEEIRNILKLKHEKLKGGNKRHIYTKRILEIIGNVEKQNTEIKKVLKDTRQLQKEINTLEGQLERCFSIADETLFKDAKRDDQAKKAYKLLALLHSECNTIVSLVNDTGMLSREIIDLEENIKAEKSKRTEDVLKKIQLDLGKLQKDT